MDFALDLFLLTLLNEKNNNNHYLMLLVHTVHYIVLTWHVFTRGKTLGGCGGGNGGGHCNMTIFVWSR